MKLSLVDIERSSNCAFIGGFHCKVIAGQVPSSRYKKGGPRVMQGDIARTTEVLNTSTDVRQLNAGIGAPLL